MSTERMQRVATHHRREPWHRVKDGTAVGAEPNELAFQGCHGAHGDGAMKTCSRRDFLTTVGTLLAFLMTRLASAEDRPTTTNEESMEIIRLGSQPSAKGPTDWFTGSVRIDPLFQPKEPARTAAANVTFEPGARTAWHTHPLGQTLIITAGIGWVQRKGGPVEEVRPGDVVWFPPGERHWHGASPAIAMTHIAIQESLDGKVVEWMEHVSDEQYRR